MSPGHHLTKVVYAFLLMGAISASATGIVGGGTFFNNSSWVRNGATLDLDFAGNQYYVNGTSYASVTALLTGVSGSFSRSSTGSYYDSTGVLQSAASDVPRIDYDPLTKEKKGLLLEPAATNFIPYSTNFATWSFQGGSTTTATAAVAAPDGTMTATTFTNASSSAQTYVYNQLAPTAPAGTAFVFSVYLTGGNLTGTGGASQVTTPCYSGVVTISATWKRYYKSCVTTTANGKFWPQITIPVSGTVTAWGAQLEVGIAPTSYIPTTGAAASRAADLMTLPTSSWLTAASGTLLVRQEYTSGSADSNPVIGVSSSDHLGLSYTGGTGPYLCTVLDGTSSSCAGSGTLTSGFTTSAVTYDSSQNQISAAGGSAVSTATGKSLATATTLRLGSDFSSVQSPAKHVNRLTYFGSTLPSAALPGLSK